MHQPNKSTMPFWTMTEQHVNKQATHLTLGLLFFYAACNKFLQHMLLHRDKRQWGRNPMMQILLSAFEPEKACSGNFFWIRHLTTSRQNSSHFLSLQAVLVVNHWNIPSFLKPGRAAPEASVCKIKPTFVEWKQREIQEWVFRKTHPVVL